MTPSRSRQAVALVAIGAALLNPSSVAGQAPRYPRPVARYGEIRVDSSAMVAMRDGVRLSTDFYVPRGAGDRLPVILMRTPYNKAPNRRANSAAYFWAGQGYAVAVQDVRGKWESEGRYNVQGGDPEDGYDTVDWLSRQPWSNGKVGTIGCSYGGDVQIMQAPLRHPALAAMIPQSAGSSIGRGGTRYHYFGARNGGAVEIAAGFGWFRSSGSQVYLKPPAWMSREEWNRVAGYFNIGPTVPSIDFKALWLTLPIADMMDRAGAPPNNWRDINTRELNDPWWDQFGYLKGTERFDTPALHINSWYDFGVTETLYEFNLMRENAESPRGRDHQYAIISPTTHCSSERTTANTVVGERPVGDAQFDHWGAYGKWFEYWLKGVDNGVTSMPKLQIYVMGRNRWRAEQEWPLARTRFTKYYLHSDGKANGSAGAGTLSPAAPRSEPPDSFTYDPKDPVPSRGGPICCTGTPDAPEGSFDQRDVEQRPDVLVYSTPALERGVEVTGPIQLVLYVSSSGKDTDFTGKLVDVYPDGTAYNVQEGILRARYREGYDKKVWMKAGEVYQLRIDLQATSNYFAPGHRIRVEVSSSNFPRFDRNLNTGGNNYDETSWLVVRNLVYHSAVRASHLLLPVIPE
ncbi:MAG: CocE/NonD family hydrolase [Gemmatimonadetes bacterium]|nr:CocE/NonD family hydrolase [Gemmatimonadota bacterium]